MDRAEVLAVHTGVELRGAEVGVAQHLLHRAQVARGLQHMAGEGMAQGMGMHARADAVRFVEDVKDDELKESFRKGYLMALQDAKP